jgi:hypothetical protein
MSLLDQVLAAKAAAEAKFADQVSNGIHLSETQNAEILIAQVQAIIGGEKPDSEPKSEPEPAKEPAP